MKTHQKLFSTFSNEYLRTYLNADIKGVEIGSMKNVMAIAAGICDGINYGDNSGALMTRGMTEII